MSEETKKPRVARPKFVSVKIPREIGDALDSIKDVCQSEDVYLSERQLVGRNGVVLAALANLTLMPEDDQFDFVMKGIKRLKEMGVTEPSVN